MEIEKCRRKCTCYRCKKPIELKYKVTLENGHNYHLSCYYPWVVQNFEIFKKNLKKFKKPQYKKTMTIMYKIEIDEGCAECGKVVLRDKKGEHIVIEDIIFEKDFCCCEDIY